MASNHLVSINRFPTQKTNASEILDTLGTFLSAEASSNPQGDKQIPSVAEDLGEKAALLLLEEIYRGGCIDSSNQHLALLLMALGPKDVSRILLGPLSPYTYVRQLQIVSKFN